ncbi:MFS transporter [Rothia kristinae]|uniref:MFS transporter n=1 Tax=Rothia kristinae TaxID=37923 RepID=A0A199NUN7_9MICC|nr:MFS transporter [Rothia kristinae]TDP54866.1 MFS transporter [Kocuria sp. AG109]MCT1356936.1 MFS transporter [Rothia kristinae]MCT1393527.1 MFS transporter [Rothia kristinae]MCT1505722.1 MFS transporter [Rothia kristinae]MCT2039033.1 MFS transporter [Rothia kristinae]
MPSETRTGDTAFDPTQRRLLTLTLVPLFMSLLSVSIVNVILPSVQADIGASSSALQWVLSGYALAFGVVLVAAGRAGDVFGRAKLFIAGVVLFGAGSLVAGLAPTPLVLNLARVVMGLGSGLLNPQVIGLMQQYFSGTQRGRAFGIFGGIVGVSVAIGPVLGGLLISVLGAGAGWRASLLVNVPICLVALIAAKPFLPASAWEPVPEEHSTSTSSLPVVRRNGAGGAGASGRRRVDLDPVGLGLFGVAIFLVMLPFVESSAGAWVWIALPVAAALLVAWVRWERRYSARGGEPMVDMGLFRTRSFANGSLLIALYFVGMTSVWVLIALYMQEGMGHTALAAGFIGLPSALASAITAPLAGRKVVQVGRPMVLWGIGLVLTGILLSIGVVVLRESVGLSEWFLLGTMVFVGVGQGLVVSPNQTLTLADVPVRYAGAAGGVLQTGQRVGTSIGIAAITGVAFSVLARTDWNMAVAVGFGLIAVIVVLAGLVGVRDQRQARAERG